MGRLAKLASVTLALVPGAATIDLAFHGGGFFPGPTAVVAMALLLVVAGRVMLVERPFAGLGRLSATAIAGLAGFALWTLVSGGWSSAPDRAIVEFDRALLYLVTLVLFGAATGSPARLRWMVRGLLAAAVVVCAAGLTTRLLPDVWPLGHQTVGTRLSFPLRYWNTLGLLAALGLTMAFGLTADPRETRVGRVLAAAATPLLGATLLLTLSRGSIATAGVGLVVVVLVGHPRTLPAALLATAPATAVAVLAAYDADLLLSADRLTAAGQAQGHHVALVVGLCVGSAALLRAVLLFSDVAVARLTPGPVTRRVLLTAGTLATVVAILVAAVAVDAPERYRQFAGTAAVAAKTGPQDARAHLTDPTSVRRRQQWDVALRTFRAHPIKGTGAGTYQLAWERDRPDLGAVRDAHSLYLEVLSELGVVGLALLLVCLLAVVAGLMRRTRGPDRVLHATVLAVVVGWALAAGVDWHWEMPVVTLGVFALGGAALARGAPPEAPPARAPLGQVPRIVMAAALAVLLVAVPGRVAISENAWVAALFAPDTHGCARVRTLAHRSIAALPSRPQPYEAEAACALRIHDTAAAIRLYAQAVAREPGNWRPRYNLAIARARAGLDPRADLRAALARDPRESEVLTAAAVFRVHVGPAAWRRLSLTTAVQPPPP